MAKFKIVLSGTEGNGTYKIVSGNKCFYEYRTRKAAEQKLAGLNMEAA